MKNMIAHHQILPHVQRSRPRQGAMLVLVAVTLVILLIAAALSVDVAYMHMVRAELRTATDAAARAGAETLARTQNANAAVASAIAVADRNVVAGNGLTLQPSDIQIGGVQGDGTTGRFQFIPGQQPFTTIRITGARVDGSADGPVSLFFGSAFGQTNFQPSQDATATSSVRDIALVLDRSGSMNASSGSGTRMSALRNAVQVFLAEVNESSPNSLVSLTSYSTGSSRDLALTSDMNAIRSRVNSLRVGGATNIFLGIRKGSDSLQQDALRRAFASRTIIVMTDGNFNRGGTPVPSAQLAASRGHTIHTITFSGGANQGIMRQVANIGGGIHIHADDAGDLATAFRDIARTLAVLLVK